MTAPSRFGCADFRLQSRITRRASMQVGLCGALGLAMPDLFRIRAQAADSKVLEPKAKSVIQLNLPGGFPHQESFDPKPEAPADYRGPFGIVKTKTGEVFSENFPRCAAVSDLFTIVRSVVGRVPDHNIAGYHLMTGYLPTAVIDYPHFGSVVSHELGSRGEMPAYVAIPTVGAPGGSGFLSSAFGPFELNADPGVPSFDKIRDFSIPKHISKDRFGRRVELRQLVERRLRKLDADANKLDTMDEFYSRATTLLTSPSAQRAFSLEGESPETFGLYGHDLLNQGGGPVGLAGRLIMARRLVEAGVRFVTVTYGAWDLHTNLRLGCASQMPALDRGLSALMIDLERRGLLDSTLVMVTSEFGRTPKTTNDGRDHWSRVYSMLLGGGGITRGQIYGASDATSAEPDRDPVLLEDLLCTVYHQLGIDSNKELLAFGTRPIEIIKDGNVVNGLLG